MTSTRPYLLRAMYEWMVDNGLTPQLLIDAEIEGVIVPREFVSDGRIVLNIAPGAVRGLDLGNEGVRFGARFSGRPHEISVPLRAVAAVFARENGAGMSFPEEEATPVEASGVAPAETGSGDGETPPDPPDPSPGRPRLKVVK